MRLLLIEYNSIMLRVVFVHLKNIVNITELGSKFEFNLWYNIPILVTST